LSRRYESLTEKHDPLAAIAAMVPFESFRPKLHMAPPAAPPTAPPTMPPTGPAVPLPPQGAAGKSAAAEVAADRSVAAERWRPIGLRRLVPLLQLLRRLLGFRHNGGTTPGNGEFAVRTQC